MSGEGPSPYAPRHLAHAGRRARHLAAPGQIGAAAHLQPMAALALEAEEASETPALARVRKGRMAIALAVSLAAVPVLVLDNLPATAETSDQHTVAAAHESVTPDSGSPRFDTPSTEAPTTTVAPTTTLAPTTTTTEAPPTTEAAVQAAAVAPPTTSAPPTTQPPPPPPGDPNDPATWERLAQCESGSNWSMNTGNGYYGGLQFTLATWREVGGAGYPHQASKAEQIKRGQILQARSGWDQWPSCSAKLGYT